MKACVRDCSGKPASESPVCLPDLERKARPTPEILWGGTRPNNPYITLIQISSCKFQISNHHALLVTSGSFLASSLLERSSTMGEAINMEE